MAQKPDSTLFTLTADSLDEALQAAVDHLRAIVEDDGYRGFVVPELVRESFELVDGRWVRAFRFRAELLPAVK